MPELRSFVPTLNETTTPSRRQLVAGLGALSLGSFGILAGTGAASAQDTTSDVAADRFGNGRRSRRRRNRRRNRRHNH